MSLYITLFDGEIVSEDDRAFRCSAACRDLMSGPRRPGKLFAQSISHFEPKRSSPSGQRFAGCVGEGSQQPETFPWFSS